MQENQYELEVLVNGKPVQEYLHQSKNFIEGKENTEFSLRLRNRTSKRALFVPTIDGLSVMNGKEASFDSSGYIVGAYNTETIDGWRTSDEDVAKFFFAKVAESYAVKIGKGGNTGIIGCAIFREKERVPQPIIIKEYIHMPYPVKPTCPWGYPHCYGGHGCYHGNSVTLTGGWGGGANLQVSSMMCSNKTDQAMSMNASAASAQANLGTGFGEVKHSPVKTVEFERENNPACVLTLHYNTRENLSAIGVEFKRPLYVSPSAFPKQSGYCEPPRN